MSTQPPTSSPPLNTSVVTVKTLDGVNKEFSPPPGMTVQAFKDLIAESIGVSADLQRLIFRGRVLQDDKTLDEYNLGGNTIHLVQRLAGTPNNTNPQPNPNARSQSATNSPQDDGGNAFIMGTIGHLDMPNGNPAPRRNSAAVRLQVANEMINRASNLLLRLEEEEEEALQEAQAASEQNSSTPAANSTGASTSGNGTARATVTPAAGSNNFMSQIANAASAAALVATVSHVPDNNNSPSMTPRQGGNATPQPPAEPPRVRELATGLQDILALQERLTPFLRLVLNVLRENRQYSSSEAPQFVYDTVSAAIHAVSHSLHALSDITVDFSLAPEARRLRAPASILVEQSTVVRATIPIMQGGMQFPGNLQNIVNAAASASGFAPTVQDGRMNFRGMQPQGPAQAQTASATPPAAGPVPTVPAGLAFPATATGTAPTAAAAPNLTAGAADPSNMFAGLIGLIPTMPGAHNVYTPALPNVPNGGQFTAAPQQPNIQMRQGTGSPGQMQLPDFLFGPGGLLSNEGIGGQRGEIYDILLSCHSHHITAQRQPRPENLNEHLEDANNASSANSSGFSATNQLEIFLQMLSAMELLYPGIRDFVSGYLLRGRDPRNDNHVMTWAKGIAKKITEWIVKTAGKELERRGDVDLESTLINVISQSLAKFIRIAIDSDSPANFRLSTVRLLEDSAHKVLVTIKATYALHTAAKFLRQLIDTVLIGSSVTLRREMIYSLVQYLETSVSNTGEFLKVKSVSRGEPLNLSVVEVSHPREIRQPVAAAAAAAVLVAPPTSGQRRLQIEDDDMDVDDDSLLQDSVPPFLRNVPSSWVDTIKNDMQAQRHAPSQPPLSHGFMCLFPPK